MERVEERRVLAARIEGFGGGAKILLWNEQSVDARLRFRQRGCIIMASIRQSLAEQQSLRSGRRVLPKEQSHIQSVFNGNIASAGFNSRRVG